MVDAHETESLKQLNSRVNAVMEDFEKQAIKYKELREDFINLKYVHLIIHRNNEASAYPDADYPDRNCSRIFKGGGQLSKRWFAGKSILQQENSWLKLLG